MKRKPAIRQARDESKKGRYDPPSLVRYGNLKNLTQGIAPESVTLDNPDPWIGTYQPS